MSYLKYSFFFYIIIFFSCKNESTPIDNSTAKSNCFYDDDTTTKLYSALNAYSNSLKYKNALYVLEEGSESLTARAWLTEHAQKSIDVQYFIFSTDNVGLIAADFLVRAADKDIKVRILVDDILVEASGKELLQLDLHPNIDIKIYNPIGNTEKSISKKIKNVVLNFNGLNQRMHNKIFLVDDTMAITGGRNVADEYFDYNHDYNFRDRDVLLIGKICKTMKSSFNLFWNSTTSISVADLIKDTSIHYNNNSYNTLHNYACDTLNFWPAIRKQITDFPKKLNRLLQDEKVVFCNEVNFVSDVPGKLNEKITSKNSVTLDSITELINHSKKNIVIQSPYFILTKQGLNLLGKKVNEGIKIHVLTNSLASTDNLEAFAAYSSDRIKFLKAGINLFEFKPDAKNRFKLMQNELQKKINFTPIFGLHAKTMVIDSFVTVIGTFNADPRSANLNTECITIIRSKKIALQVLKHFATDFNEENSWKVTQAFNPDNIAGSKKQVKSWIRKVLPKRIL